MQLKPGAAWTDAYARARAAAPEAFDADRILNLTGGDWQRSGDSGEHVTPVDGTPIQGPPRDSHDEAAEAVAYALGEHKAWGTRSPSTSARAACKQAVDGLQVQRDTLALLLAWEIGKPWKLACADVDRAPDGVRWYLGEIDRQMHEECTVDRWATDPVTFTGVGGERVDSAAVQWDLARLAELGEADRQDAFGEVDIVAVEAEGLADAKPGHRGVRARSRSPRLCSRGP